MLARFFRVYRAKFLGDLRLARLPATWPFRVSKILTSRAGTHSWLRRNRSRSPTGRLLFTRTGKPCAAKVVLAGPGCNRTPIKATPIVARNGHCSGIIVCAAKTHCNSTCHSHGEHRSFSAPSPTPGRCNVAAIFYYKDNLIHIATGGSRGSRTRPALSDTTNGKYVMVYLDFSLQREQRVRDDVIFNSRPRRLRSVKVKCSIKVNQPSQIEGSQTQVRCAQCGLFAN